MCVRITGSHVYFTSCCLAVVSIFQKVTRNTNKCLRRITANHSCSTIAMELWTTLKDERKEGKQKLQNYTCATYFYHVQERSLSHFCYCGTFLCLQSRGTHDAEKVRSNERQCMFICRKELEVYNSVGIFIAWI